jgi:hypothetical protein
VWYFPNDHYLYKLEHGGLTVAERRAADDRAAQVAVALTGVREGAARRIRRGAAVVGRAFPVRSRKALSVVPDVAPR